jgi:fatty-acyl-CoA synthase
VYAIVDVLAWVAEAVPDRAAVVQGDEARSFRQLLDRSRALASGLGQLGLGCHRERPELKPWESGQSHVALYLHNSIEYLEAMIGCYRARAVPFNVNYRYVPDELAYLFNDAAAAAIIYHRCFADEVGALADRLPEGCVLIEVDDGSQPEAGPPGVQGAIPYELLIEGGAEGGDSARLPPVSPDDLHLLYTGGTTGMPKGVAWRQAELVTAMLAGVHEHNRPPLTADDYQARARKRSGKELVAPPLMHAVGQWNALRILALGSTVVLHEAVRSLDAADIWRTVERERAHSMIIVGDAFAVPLLDELRTGSYDVSSLRLIRSSGAALQPAFKDALCGLVPGARVVDIVGSTEGGAQGSTVWTGEAERGPVRFEPRPNGVVLNNTTTAVLDPGHNGLGWWAVGEPIPLGYLNDQAKTERTFITVEGRRYSVPGDRARHLADGRIELHGRDSATINTGGEKVFAEEVEAAVRDHPAVADVIVVGRPSERWGNEVVAVVQLRPGHDLTLGELQAVAGAQLARYKVPRAMVVVDSVKRAPSGKPDYRWARSVAASEEGDR